MKKSKILLTGAAGFIGTHTWVALHQNGYDVVGVDNFCNSSAEIFQPLSVLVDHPQWLEADVRNWAQLDQLFAREKFDAVIHFAALKAVGESNTQPLRYHQNNINGLLTLLDVMQRHNCRNLVFSSSATVYGQPDHVPIHETAATRTTNPYGRTKLIGEQILSDVQQADPTLRVAILRYFNPVGAHPSGLIGEKPIGTPNNLMPYIAQVAAGLREKLHVFGNDYPTKDGTGVRDYIHVMDLAQGHVASLDYLLGGGRSDIFNLGTGTGYSVLEVIKAYESASGRSIPYVIDQRRAGDIASCYANVDRAKDILNWQATYDLSQMCEDSWRWQQRLCHHIQH